MVRLRHSMALQSRSDECKTEERTEDTRSVTTEPAAARRHVLRACTYLHVLDEDTGVTRLVTGPCSYTLKQNERVTLGPQPMVVVPSAHYCVVESPVVRVDGLASFDDVGQARLRHGEREVRLHQPPFPLYPDETLACSVQPLLVVGANQALRLRAVQDTTDNEGTECKAGDEWLMNRNGTYIPAVGEEVVELLEAIILTSRQYCVICIPAVDDKPQLNKILHGPQSFFLQRGAVLVDGVRDKYFLQVDEGLDLGAREAFPDETVTPVVSRSLGDRWTVRGPAAVVPPVEADVLRRHTAIPLGHGEGVYVQNTVTGEVRAEMDKPYLLTAEERLWSKELSPDAERLMTEYRRETGTGAPQRDKTRVVTFVVPSKWYAVVENRSGGGRDVRGPELVSLLPDEQFRVFSLPGGTPVVLNHSKSLTLPLGVSILLIDIITVTRENRERCALTIQAAWGVPPHHRPAVTLVDKDDANRAFWDLRRCLLEDGRTNNISKSYTFGVFYFFGIYISDTRVLGLDKPE